MTQNLLWGWVTRLNLLTHSQDAVCHVSGVLYVWSWNICNFYLWKDVFMEKKSWSLGLRFSQQLLTYWALIPVRTKKVGAEGGTITWNSYYKGLCPKGAFPLSTSSCCLTFHSLISWSEFLEEKWSFGIRLMGQGSEEGRRKKGVNAKFTINFWTWNKTIGMAEVWNQELCRDQDIALPLDHSYKIERKIIWMLWCTEM